jgi:hypothetical protein
MNSCKWAPSLAILAILFHPSPVRAQQIADSSFAPPIASPAHPPGAGPRVLIDEAHHNLHTMSGRFLAFATLLRRDGYAVAANASRFSRERLAGLSILVISNALARENEEEWSLPTPSAFDSAEIAAVKEWGERGWSPMAHRRSHAVPWGGGTARRGVLSPDVERVRARPGRAGWENALQPRGRFAHGTPDHEGQERSGAGRFRRAFTGQAFRIDAPGTPLMKLRRDVVLLLPEVAWQFSRLTQRMSAAGMLQGAALNVGRGRVAVFGEAAMFSAQLSGPNRAPMGMSQNPQFVLNAAHWLDGSLK